MNRRKEKSKDRAPHWRGRQGGGGSESLLTGKLHIARNGAGFVVDPETDEAIWIEVPDLDTALPGDTVTIRRETGPRRGKFRRESAGKGGPSARLVRIEERADRAIVGTVSAVGSFTRVQPLSPTFRQEFIVPDARGASEGDRVVMRFVRWHNRRLAPEGEITEVIGRADDPSLDTLATMKQYDLPEGFPDAVLAEAELVGELKCGDRLDLRGKYVFTCDPETARDYDDALSLECDARGRRVLGVHIADVSHYVRPGTALDREAYRRSTSVYLVDKVVPMLPEQLSNGVCSLVPNEDRCAFTAFLTFDERGNCVERRFAKTFIRSRARFTYEQVMAVIAGAKGRAAPKGVKAPERKTILAVHELAQQLRARRFADGALDMQVPEAEVKLDARGMMIGVEVRPYDESHQMIEECMVAANEAVAKELWTKGVNILARLHEPPAEDKLEELRAQLSTLGVSCGDLSQPKNLARLLERIKGTPLEGTISVMVLRSMKRALYSPKAMGHFGLAKRFYAHFTSPIRRYPDLTLHRQLSAYLAGKGGRVEAERLSAAGVHCSEREQNADDAERSLLEIKKYRFLAAAGERTFDAVVSKCTRHGVFVDLPEIAAGGMVHISKLADAYVRWDEFDATLSAGGRTWSIGTKMRVRVERVDFDRRLVDFVPVADDGAKTSSQRSRKGGKGGRTCARRR